MTDFELIEVVIGILGLVLAVLLKLWDEKTNAIEFADNMAFCFNEIK